MEDVLCEVFSTLKKSEDEVSAEKKKCQKESLQPRYSIENSHHEIPSTQRDHQGISSLESNSQQTSSFKSDYGPTSSPEYQIEIEHQEVSSSETDDYDESSSEIEINAREKYINEMLNIHQVRYAQAILENQLDVLQELIEKGIKPNINMVADALVDADCDRQLRNILLKSGVDTNQSLKYGGTLLTLASGIGDVESVKVLLEVGANVNLVRAADVNLSPVDLHRDSENSPLLAAILGENPEVIVKILLDHGANVNCRSPSGETALMTAMKLDNQSTPETVSAPLLYILNHYGLDVNAANDCEETALFYAAESANRSILSILINKGADINAVNSFGRNALMTVLYSYQSSYRSSVALFLIDKGIDVNVVDQFGDTCLSRCAIMNNFECLPFLIYDACLESADESKFLHYFYTVPMYLCSPLFIALKSYNLDLARKVVKSNLLTPFDLFVMPNHPKVREDLSKSDLSESLEFIHEMSSSVPSLFQLAFVQISASVRFGRGRRERVEQLPLPDLIKRKLNFIEDTS